MRPPGPSSRGDKNKINWARDLLASHRQRCSLPTPLTGIAIAPTNIPRLLYAITNLGCDRRKKPGGPFVYVSQNSLSAESRRFPM